MSNLFWINIWLSVKTLKTSIKIAALHTLNAYELPNLLWPKFCKFVIIYYFVGT